MRWQEHGTYFVQIERVDPPRHFAYRAAQTADEMPRPGNATLVTFTLIPEGSGTRLRVEESGFQDLELSPAERVAQAEVNITGWSGGLSALQEYARQLAVAATP
jgi:uncharacterized protein YndB with AHSA1/START domain